MGLDLPPGSLFIVRQGSGIVCLADLERLLPHGLEDRLTYVMKFMLEAFSWFERCAGCCAVGKAYGNACYVFVEKGFDRVFRKHGGVLTYRGVEFALVRADAQKVLQLVGFLDRVDEKLVRQAEQAVCHQNTGLWKRLTTLWRR
ncbi:MAG: hypothetical protein QXH32_05240 [Candidatus Caldarchaeum sp.]